MNEEKKQEVADYFSEIVSMCDQCIYDCLYDDDNIKQKIDTISFYIKKINRILKNSEKSDIQ